MRPCLLCLLIASAGCAASETKVACPEKQAHDLAVKTICFVDEQVAYADDEPPLDRSRKRSQWLDAVANPEAIYLKTMLSVKPSSEQSRALRQEARDAELASCPLADEIERDELSALSP
jgi:hypothetical protein